MTQRPIKFRAWDKKRMKMLPVTWIFLGETDYTIQLFDFEEKCNIVWNNIKDDVILMQFTGLTDKNGKEIYEGDIVDDGNGILGEVRWRRSGFEQRMINTLGWWVVQEEGKIISNIYENPELLR